MKSGRDKLFLENFFISALYQHYKCKKCFWNKKIKYLKLF